MPRCVFHENIIIPIEWPTQISVNEGPEYTSNFNLMGMLWNGTVFNAMRCAEGSDFSALILSFSPYLYPFSIEYSILVGTHYL